MLQSKVSDIEYNINHNNNLYTGKCLRNTLYYPKSVTYNNEFLNIKYNINRRQAINCISKPNSVKDGELQARNILELNGHEINIGTNSKETGTLNVNYKSTFNNTAIFNNISGINRQIIFDKPIRFNYSSSGYYYIIDDPYENEFLINREVKYNHQRLNKVNAYFCTKYSNNTRLLKLTPTVGFQILKHEENDFITTKAVEYNLEHDTFTVNTEYINLTSNYDLVIKSYDHITLKSIDKQCNLRISSYGCNIKYSNMRLDIEKNKIELRNTTSSTHKIQLFNDRINIQSDGDVQVNSFGTVTLKAKQNENSDYGPPVFQLSSNRVHLDDCLGTAMLDNKVVNTNGNTETYLNYPEILSESFYKGVHVNTERAIKLQRTLNLGVTPGEYVGNSILTLNGDKIYLDGFESDATLTTILSSEFGQYFSSSDNGYKCDLQSLIKAILAKLII